MKHIRQIAGSQLIIFAVALTTRVAAVVVIFKNFFGPDLLYMQNEPSHIASALVSGCGFSHPYAGAPIAPTAQQPPLYPLIMATIFRIFGSFTPAAAYAAVGLNILAGALTAVLLYRIGKLYFNETVGIATAWVWTLPWMYPNAPFSVSLSNAHLAALAFAALVLILSKVITANHGWFALGIFLGILVLLQTSFLPVFVAYGLWLALAKGHSSQMILVLLGLVLTLAPWTLRDYLLLGRLIPLRDNFGLELWLGNRPGMQGTVDYSGDFPDHDPSTYARLGELAYMDSKFKEARTFIASDPHAFLVRCLRRVMEFWYLPYSRSWLVVSLLAWSGALQALRHNDWAGILGIPLAIFPLIYYVTHTFPTYRLPIEPLVILLATFSLVEMITFLRRMVRHEPEAVHSASKS